MRLRTVAAGLGLTALLSACTAPAPPRSELATSAAAGSGMSTCKRPEPPIKTETPTTIDVVEEAYYCILAHYYAGPTLDAYTLLTAGFIAMTQELNRNGRDSAEATVPAYKGERWADWKEFEKAYRKVTDTLPAALRTKLAEATLDGIVASLDNNHARWAHDAPSRPLDYYSGDQYGLGLRVSVKANAPAALPPVFITAVLGGPAKEAGLKPGDIIEEVNGSATFIDQKIISAAVAALAPKPTDTAPVRLRVLRETTGRRWNVTLQPVLHQPDFAQLQLVSAKRLPEGVAYVRLAGFGPQVASRIFKTLTRMSAKGKLTGLVLDLRGNGGGSPTEANLLASAFAHGKVTAYMCTVDGSCKPSKTDDGVTLLNLPLVVLTDRGCASACEHFSSAVKDLRVGTLVGTRTAGLIAGPASPWLLTSNNTVLSFPSTRHLAPNREVIDKVGVAPDHYLPSTAKDVATGRDPALDKALSLLGGSS